MTNDERIISMREQIAKKTVELEKIGRFRPVTNCSIEFLNVRYNLHTLQYDAAMFLAVQLQSLLTAQFELDYPDIKISGFTLIDWIEDINGHLAEISLKEKKQELITMQRKLDGMLSADKKTELALQEMEKILK